MHTCGYLVANYKSLSRDFYRDLAWILYSDIGFGLREVIHHALGLMTPSASAHVITHAERSWLSFN